MPKTAVQKTRDYRQKLRQRGLRPIQIWIPDVRHENFSEEVRRQSMLVQKSTDEQKAIDLIENVFESV